MEHLIIQERLIFICFHSPPNHGFLVDVPSMNSGKLLNPSIHLRNPSRDEGARRFLCPTFKQT